MKPNVTEPAVRSAHRQRATKETKVDARLVLDGKGQTKIETGIGFLNHMLELLTHHAGFDLELTAAGDLHVDCHHTVEDVGLVLGDCLDEALGDRSGVNRFGAAYVPLDEALSRAVVDLSGRGYLHWSVPFSSDRLGDFPSELFEDFFRAFATRSRATLHVESLYGRNNHHVIETVFKALGRALRHAVCRDSLDRIPSTKGTIRD